MATITADKIIYHDLFAKDIVNGYDITHKNILYTFYPKQLIGNVYSYIIGNDGQVYWLVYVTKQDYNNQIATYILHDPSKIDVPDLPGIMQKIADEQKAAAIEKNGVVGYYVEKYLPYIVGAIVVAVALPSIVKSFKK